MTITVLGHAKFSSCTNFAHCFSEYVLLHCKAVDSVVIFYKFLQREICCSIEKFSTECHKTKTKVITLANQKNAEQSIVQSKLEAITQSTGILVQASHD